MSTQTMQAVVLICDGCGAEVGGSGEFRSAVEARAAAYGQGWRYPPKVNAQGREGTTTNDVCPACIGTWSARPAGRSSATGPQYRAVSQARSQ